MGRVRAPSARALEAAEAALHAKSTAKQQTPAPAPAKKATKKSPPPKAAAKAKGKAPAARGKGKAKEESVADEDELMSVVEEEDEPQQAKEEDRTLYCICLGYDNGVEPMIQCEYCANWFHFGCVGLNAQEAETIDGYSCDFCQQMGHPPTRKLPPIPIVADDDFADEPSEPEDEEEEEFEQDGDSDAHISQNSSDEEGGDGDGATTSAYGTRGTKRAKRSGAGAKRRKIEEEALDSDDGDYVGDEDEKKPRPKAAPKRKASATPAEGPSSKPSSSKAAGASGASSTSARPAPPTDKTRTACRAQLGTMFKSVFGTVAGAPSVATESRAAAFAEEVEGEMFDSFGELDQRGSKAPRTKYLAKFRSLHFNLKTNPTFRSRVAANELTPAQIVNLSNEDLLTPELRAMAESVRAASLKDSLREAPTLPTAKRTHKGEEEIDGAMSVAKEAAAQEKELEKRERVERQREQRRRASEGGAEEGSPAVGDDEEEEEASEEERDDSPQGEREKSPPTRFSPSRTTFDSPKREDGTTNDDKASATPTQRTPVSRARNSLSSTTNVTLSAEELGIADDDDVKPAAVKQEDEAAEAKPVVVEAPAEVQSTQPRRSESFDMASIWGNVKAASPVIGSHEGTPAEGDAESSAAKEKSAEAADDEYDPFRSITGRGKNDAQDDDDFDAALLRDRDSTDNMQTPSKPSASGSTPAEAAPTATALKDLDRVWEGDLLVPEEGGFPGWAVQTGGRCLGPASEIWRQLLPRGLTMDGRIPTHTAAKYLVDCSFAPTRELVLVAILPDLSGPNAKNPHKPAKEKCEKKYAHIVQFYKRKDRVGVIQPPAAMRKLVKDIYIVPLAKADPLPDYVELLDGEGMLLPREREEDMLLAVLVVQKNALPTYVKTGLTPAKQSTASGAASSTPTAAPRGPSRLSAPPITANQDDEAYIPGIAISGLHQGSASSASSRAPSARPTAADVIAAVAPPAAPPAPAAMPAFDQTALEGILKNQELMRQAQSLLANPSLLASLGGALSPAPAQPGPRAGLSPQPYAPQQGYNYQPQGRSPYGAPSGGGAYAPQGASPWGHGSGYAQQPQAYAPPSGGGGGGYEPQASLGWNSGARSPMPGVTPQSPPRQQQSSGGGAGYVHPSRLAMLGGAPQPSQQQPQQSGGRSPAPRAGGDQGWGGRRPSGGY